MQQLSTEENLLFGGAVNPRDAGLTVTEEGDELIFNGHKSFSTGGVASDLTVLEEILDGTQTHIFRIVPTKQDGIVFANDWN